MSAKTTMTFQEKSLYHQIHPIKLATDIGMTFPALYLFWQRELIVTFVPSMIITALVIRFANLEPYQQSALGHYIQQYMTSSIITGLRLFGLLVMCVGAWQHVLWLIPVGLLLGLLAWTRGLLFPSRSANKKA